MCVQLFFFFFCTSPCRSQVVPENPSVKTWISSIAMPWEPSCRKAIAHAGVQSEIIFSGPDNPFTVSCLLLACHKKGFLICIDDMVYEALKVLKYILYENNHVTKKSLKQFQHQPFRSFVTVTFCNVNITI